MRRAERRRRERASQATPARRPGWRFVPWIVAILTFVAFLPALRAEFVSFDDVANFVANPGFRGLDWPHLQWMWTTTLLGHYVPFSWMTLGLDYLLWGMNPAGYHLVNLLLHSANAVLVYLIARRVFAAAGIGTDGTDDGAILPSALAALVFAVHPLRVESVAWITERRDVLSLLFALASTLSFLRAVAEPVRFNRWYGLSLAAFAAALLSKATTVTLPAVLLILNTYPLRRIGGHSGWWSGSARRVYVEVAPYAVLAAAASVLSVVVLHPGAQLPVGAKLAVSAYSLAFYLAKTIAPFHLAPLYQMSRPVDPFAPSFLASYAIVAMLAVAVWTVRRKYPGVVAGALAFTVVVFPLLGVVQNGPQIAADRYTYHAAPALAMLIAGGASVLWTSTTLASIGAVVVFALGLGVWRQCGVWQNSEQLWSRVLEVDGKAAIAHNNLGVLLAERGQTTAAIVQYTQAIQNDSSYADPHNNLGYELAAQGRADAAIEQYKAAKMIKPSYAEAEINWGNALSSEKRFEEATTHYARALELLPGNAAAEFDWGLALEAQNKLPEAAEHLSRAVLSDPSFTDARDALARVTR